MIHDTIRYMKLKLHNSGAKPRNREQSGSYTDQYHLHSIHHVRGNTTGHRNHEHYDHIMNGERRHGTHR